jgi:hypothetical protein
MGMKASEIPYEEKVWCWLKRTEKAGQRGGRRSRETADLDKFWKCGVWEERKLEKEAENQRNGLKLKLTLLSPNTKLEKAVFQQLRIFGTASVSNLNKTLHDSTSAFQTPDHA